MSWITDRWELKIVALVTAIALWIYTSGQVRTERAVVVTLSDADVSGLPVGMRIATITPREFTVRLSAPLGRWSEGGPDVRPRLVLRAEDLADGHQELPLTSRSLGFGSDIRIVGTEPAVTAISVAVARSAEEILPVDPPKVLTPAGFDAVIELDHTLVTVRGDGVLLTRLRDEGLRIAVVPVDLRAVDAVATPVQRVALRPQDAALELPQRPVATITLLPIRGTKRTVTVPVTVLMGEGMRSGSDVVLDPQVATITVHGSEERLKALRPEAELVAYVAVRADLLKDQPHVLPVSLVGPVWLAADPVMITVTVRAR